MIKQKFLFSNIIQIKCYCQLGQQQHTECTRLSPLLPDHNQWVPVTYKLTQHSLQLWHDHTCLSLKRSLLSVTGASSPPPAWMTVSMCPCSTVCCRNRSRPQSCQRNVAKFSKYSERPLPPFGSTYLVLSHSKNLLRDTMLNEGLNTVIPTEIGMLVCKDPHRKEVLSIIANQFGINLC